MKKSLILVLAAALLFSCKMGTPKGGDSHTPDAAEKAKSDSANFTTVAWLDSTFIDMGDVTKGQMLDVIFHFKNTGNKPLYISSVTASCGCTVPETPKKPFGPGEEGEIKARFNSAGQSAGPHRKSVYVTANTSPSTYNVLEFNANVVEK